MDSGRDALHRPGMTKECLTGGMHITTDLPVVPMCRTSFTLPRRANHNDNLARPAATRGAARDRHGRRLRDAMDAHRRARLICATNGVCADGEVVWFWRLDAGAKPVQVL
jgi:hypothetical protein